MLTIVKCLLSSCADYKIFKDEKQVGMIFKRKDGESFPNRFQVTGDGRRTFYSTLKECMEHFK